MQRKEQALKEKDLGNAAYKAKNFDVAITHYDKAYELYDEDISFLTNRWVHQHMELCGIHLHEYAQLVVSEAFYVAARRLGR